MVNTVSKSGLQFIAHFEGFVDKCYDDGGKPGSGNCTIGYGHLVHYGPTTPADHKRWGCITRAHALDLLRVDAHAAVLGVRDAIKIPLTQGQFDALVSFAFNCGVGALKGDVARAVNAKPKRWRLIKIRAWRKSVQNALLEWVHFQGRVNAGLKRRRIAEGNLFATGKYKAS